MLESLCLVSKIWKNGSHLPKILTVREDATSFIFKQPVIHIIEKGKQLYKTLVYKMIMSLKNWQSCEDIFRNGIPADKAATNPGEMQRNGLYCGDPGGGLLSKVAAMTNGPFLG